ncbi:MAG TPA: VOC family protein [Acidimicrobiales bacterium]|nr:VOC family protein [Acidimicrobiales bacterium]
MNDMRGRGAIRRPSMRLAQARIVTEDVEGAASFYASVVGVRVCLNEFYVEVPAGDATVGFSKARYTECGVTDVPQVILDFEVDDVDEEFARLDALDVDWVQLPTTQPWGNRSMTFKAPEGLLVNVFSRSEGPNGLTRNLKRKE